MKLIIDGNTACSKGAYPFSEIACIYPITPSSPMASNVDLMRTKNIHNIFNDTVKVVEMESEAGAVGAMHGALLSGSLAVSFTASQGLLLMIPNMYKIAGEGLPGVIHVASRTVASHALSIFGDHSDIYATRQTGFCMLASCNVTEAYYFSVLAHLSAIKGQLPFLHFFDGFRTSHELNTVDLIDSSAFASLIDKEALENYKKRCLNVGSKYQYGMNENEDIYFQSLEARSGKYEKMVEIVTNYMNQINNIADCDYKLFNYYGDESATDIIIAMGSVCDTIKLVIEKEKNRKLGVVIVHLYRPFSAKALKNVIPSTVKNIAVLDRTKEAGSTGEPLYLDVLSALNGMNYHIVGGRYGISSKNTPPKDILAVYDMLQSNLKNNFTIGIVDDVNNTSLAVKNDYQINLPVIELKVYGFGSDGMVSASKDLLKIIGENQKYVQGYFEYDSKKSGGVTISHLRIGNKAINAPYYVTNADLIVVSKDEYFHKYHLLDEASLNAIILVSTNDEASLLEKMTNHDYEIIKNRHLKILVIDAEDIALKCGIKGKINKVMESIMLNLLGVTNAVDILEERIKKEFNTKGIDVVENNIKAIKQALLKVKKLTINDKVSDYEITCTSLLDKIEHRMANDAKVSEVIDYSIGAFINDKSKLEKRRIATYVPKWIKENCISCGLCSLVCPHAVIRPFVTNENIGIPINDGKKNFFIGISEEDCTSCGLCLSICPGKNNKKALTFGKFTNENKDIVNRYFNNYENPVNSDVFNIKNSQLRKPRLEFSGACAGCGQTSYIKLLTQLFQDEIIIANATGCSSIYGGSIASPYSIPWANSLFEDNAQFALGINESFNLKRERIKKILQAGFKSDLKIDELYQKALDNFDDYNTTMSLKNELALCNIPMDLRELLDYLPKRTVWAIGGDGWAYDIGFGGIDHALASNENIKILVLDTEVYSNTGGQMSKASQIGQVAEFADWGKKTVKKDLFKIALTYPNCYVASVCMGANPMQTIKAMKEANLHKGPSIIICYAPCIEHGIKGGLSCTSKEQKLAVEVGYTLLMRFDPVNNKLFLDSKEPDFSRYEQFLENEVRYKALKIKDEKLADLLFKQNQENAKQRYNYYKKLADND